MAGLVLWLLSLNMEGRPAEKSASPVLSPALQNTPPPAARRRQGEKLNGVRESVRKILPRCPPCFHRLRLRLRLMRVQALRLLLVRLLCLLLLLFRGTLNLYVRWLKVWSVLRSR